MRELYKTNTVRLAVEASKRLRVPGTEVQSVVAILPNMFIRQEGVPYIYPAGAILQSVQPAGAREPGTDDLSLRLVVITPWGQVSKLKDRLARTEVGAPWAGTRRRPALAPLPRAPRASRSRGLGAAGAPRPLTPPAHAVRSRCPHRWCLGLIGGVWV